MTIETKRTKKFEESEKKDLIEKCRSINSEGFKVFIPPDEDERWIYELLVDDGVFVHNVYADGGYMFAEDYKAAFTYENKYGHEITPQPGQYESTDDMGDDNIPICEYDDGAVMLADGSTIVLTSGKKINKDEYLKQRKKKYRKKGAGLWAWLRHTLSRG
jgi:hypothetical protein